MTQISRPLSGQFFRKNGGFQEEGDESYLLLRRIKISWFYLPEISV
jgi:hypothetical protein